MLNSSDIELFNYFLTSPIFRIIFILLTIWVLTWKGIALWRAARNNQRNWFIALLIINTVGILEIIYIFYLSKPKTLSVDKEPDNSSKMP